MKKKIIGILVCMLLIATVGLPVAGNANLPVAGNANLPVAGNANTGRFTWSTEIVDSSLVGLYTSIALNSSSDNPCISYYDALNGDLKYAYYDLGWHIDPVDSTDIVGLYTSIALDSSNNPRISYYDVTNGDLKYAYYDGIGWHNETVDSTDIVGLYTSIALDSSNSPHISYYDNTKMALKYATVTRAKLEIGDITGGFRVSSSVKNIALSIDAINVVWEIKFDGMLIFLPPGGIVPGGPVKILSGKDVPITGRAIGFGGFFFPLNIIVSADADNAAPVSKTVSAKKILVFFVIT